MSVVLSLLLLFLVSSPFKAGSVPVIALYGSGATSVTQLLSGTAGLVSAHSPRLHVHYAGAGSETGRQNFLDGNVHFSESTIPLTHAQEAQLKARQVAHLTLPHVMETISVFTYIPGKEKTPLRLTAPLVAKIFQGEITRWNDVELVTLNPQLRGVNTPINVLVRGDACGSTYIFSQWLETAAPATWHLGANTLVSFPRTPFFHREGGTLAVAAAFRASPFSIGYLSSATGRLQKLTEALLRNAAGTYLTSYVANQYQAIPTNLPPAASSWADVNLVLGGGGGTGKTFQVSISSKGSTGASSSEVPKGSKVSVVSLSPHAWPMTTFVYTLVSRDFTELGSAGESLQTFLLFMNSPTGQSVAHMYGFTRVPSAVAARNVAAIRQITLAPGVHQAGR